MYDPLIYGKSNLENLVSLEAHDGYLELFTQEEDGSVVSSHVPNKYWILAPKCLGKNWNRLKGDLYYKWGRQFTSREEFTKFRSIHKKDDIYSIYDPKEAAMVKDGITYFKNLKHDQVSSLAFDIESTGLNHDVDSKVLIISNTFRKLGTITRKLFLYSDYSSQGEMLEAWCEWVREVDPTFIIGHNIISYDIPYLQYIADREGVTLDLGRDGSSVNINTRYESFFRIDGSREQAYHKVHIYGREVVDTLFLAVRYDAVAKKYESYALKAIIAQEGLEVKDRQFYDAGEIRFKYTIPEEWEKIKKYALHDADDALALYDLMAPAFFYLTQSVPKSFQSVLESASGSQINSVMVRSYLQEGHSIPKASLPKPFEGAVSFGNPGIINNLFKIDVASLYPSIMIEYEVYDEEKDPSQNFLRLVKTFTEMRLEYKAKAKTDKYFDDLQNAFKIFINSCYGFLGTPGLQFNSPDGAEFVTATGREILQKSIEWADYKGYKIANADTDSIMFYKPDQSEFTEFEQKNLLDDVNKLYPKRIRFEHDGIYKKAIIVKAKNYILYDGKKIKNKGSALKASTKEKALKEFINEVISHILEDKNNYSGIYHKYVKETKAISDIKRWVARKTISDKTLSSERANESKIRDAIQGTDYREGDRCYLYFTNDKSLKLVEHFQNDHNQEILLKKLHDTAKIFGTVLDVKTLFPNYSLKRNKELLERIDV